MERNFQIEIDTKFADIQRFINMQENLPDDVKMNMIATCIQCNDYVIRVYEDERNK